MKYDWYKRNPTKFIGGTVGLTFEEKGAYSIVLDLIYDHSGACPNDSRWIAGILCLSTRRWNRIRDTLIVRGKLYVASDGTLHNPKADAELKLPPFDGQTTEKRSEYDGISSKKPPISCAKVSDKSPENDATLSNSKGLTHSNPGRHAGARDRARIQNQNPESEARSPPPNQRATDAGRLATLSKLLDLDYNRSPTGAIAYIQQMIDLERAGIDIERDLIPCVEQMLAGGRDVRGKPFTYFRQPALDFQKARAIAAEVEAEAAKQADARIAAMTTADWTPHVLWWLFVGEWPEDFGAPPLQVGCRAPIEAHVIRNLFKKLDEKPYAKRSGSGFEPFAWPSRDAPKLLCSDLKVADMERFFGGGYDARSHWWARPATAAEIGAILDQYDPKRPKLGAM